MGDGFLTAQKEDGAFPGSNIAAAELSQKNEAQDVTAERKRILRIANGSRNLPRIRSTLICIYEQGISACLLMTLSSWSAPETSEARLTSDAAQNE